MKKILIASMLLATIATSCSHRLGCPSKRLLNNGDPGGRFNAYIKWADKKTDVATVSEYKSDALLDAYLAEQPIAENEKIALKAELLSAMQ